MIILKTVKNEIKSKVIIKAL